MRGVAVAANDYVGVLRRRVASKMATPASQVRLLFSGVRPPLMKPLCLMRLHTCLCYSRSQQAPHHLRLSIIPPCTAASVHHVLDDHCLHACTRPQQHLFGKRGLRRCGCAGQELKSDSRLVRDVGLTEGHSIHAIITPNANAYTEPGQLQAAQDEAASPATLLAQQARSRSICVCLPCSHTAIHMFATDKGQLHIREV